MRGVAMSGTSFEPSIIAFCCHFCAYNAADLAGSLRVPYPPSVRIIKVMCTGRIDMRFMLRCLAEGADGVLAAGCLEGECHYMEGNLRARKRIDGIKRQLDETGIEPERLRMINISASDGPLFARLVTEFAADLKQMGPSPVRLTERKVWEEHRDRSRT